MYLACSRLPRSRESRFIRKPESHRHLKDRESHKMNRTCFLARIRVSSVAVTIALLSSVFPVHAESARMELSVDASQVSRRILHVKMKIPAAPGPITLVYPKWIPGEHGPVPSMTLWGSSSGPVRPPCLGSETVSICMRFILKHPRRPVKY